MVAMALKLPQAIPTSFTESDASTPLLGTGVMRSSRSRSKRGETDGGQAYESAIFSPPAKTRAEELKRVQLLESTKTLKKKSLLEATMPFQPLVTGAAGSVTTVANGPSGQASSTPAVNRYETNDLLRLLVSEIASMRCTLDSLAQDGAILAEIQKTNKLLALTLTSGRRLEGYEHPRDHSLLVERIKEKEKSAEIILKTV